MAEKQKVSFERIVPGEEALVISDGLKNLDHPILVDLLKQIGITPKLFEQLITGQCELLNPPKDEEFAPNGKKLEDIKLGIAKTELGHIEVSEITLHPDAIDPNDITLHLKQPDQRGFEAILVLDGEGTLRFPDSANPVTPGVYARSDKGTDVNVNTGDLVLIPAPTANGWTKATEGFKFRYVGLPPWNSNFVVPAF